MLRRIVRRVIVDSFVILLSYTIANLACYVIRSDPAWILPVSWFWIILVTFHIGVNATFGFYHRIWGSGSVLEPLWLLVSTGISTFGLFTLYRLAFPSVEIFDLLVIYLIGAISTCAGFLLIRYRLFIWRRILFKMNGVKIEGQNRVLIVGMTREAQQLAIHLDNDDLHRFKVMGFIGHNPQHKKMIVVQWPVLGVPSDIPKITEDKKIDIILIVQNGVNGIDLNDIINICQLTIAQIKILPDGLDVLNNNRWDLSLLRDVTVEDLLEREPAEIDEVMCLAMIKDKVVLVTGASGSIGSELCRQIIKYQPSQLIILDNNESALHDLNIELQRKLNYPNSHSVLADITCSAKIKELFDSERPNLVFHAAAYKHVPMLQIYPEEAVRTNILGTMILSECAARFDTERFVFISTDKAVNPESVMGATKRICEMWLRALNHIAGQTTYTIVRFGNVIGSRGSVVPIFKRQIEWGGPLTVTHQDMTRYFMSIPEAVSLVLHAMTLNCQDETYMFDMGKRISILDLAQRMILVRGLRVDHDIGISFTGIRPGEKLHEELFYGGEIRRTTKHSRIFSLRDIEPGPDLKTMLGVILLLADVAQRQNVTHILRRAVLISAYQDWDTLVQLVTDMDLLETYQPPAALLDGSVLIDHDIIRDFIREYSPPTIVHEV